jgi:hypothetical protein
VREGLQ